MNDNGEEMDDYGEVNGEVKPQKMEVTQELSGIVEFTIILVTIAVGFVVATIIN